ncbi:MAG: sensor domain-containing diguanylate cyclase [Lysobacteraceae bacterium]|nr:MAG: sensor domain-containing diguanylate cyclase [Xanthomonadaceae bacterium]
MDIEILKQAVQDSRDGITISEVRDGGNPLIFVNPAFERMTGYAFEEITNVDCRYLQNGDRDQPAIAAIRHAIAAGEYCLVTLRNYRRDGTMFWNELSLSPIFDRNGRVTNFIGIQKDVTARVLIEERLMGENRSLGLAAENLASLAMKDGLTGIYNRRFFDTQLEIQEKIALRTKAELTLIMVDIDHFKEFNTQYGHPGGDAVLRTVARSLNESFTRASDFVARYGGEEFAILSTGLSVDNARRFGEALCARIRNLKIPHARAPRGFLTISAGYAVQSYNDSDLPAALVERADKALYLAKSRGRDQCAGEA